MLTSPDCGLYGVAIETIKNAGPVLAAIAAACVAIFGWLVKSIVSLAIWNYDECQKRIDLMTAIKSEVDYNLKGERYFAGQGNLYKVLEVFDRPTGLRQGYIPYSATTAAPPLLSTLTERFLILPAAVSSVAFKYFNVSDALNAQLNDFRSETFLTIGRKRQRAVIVDLYTILGADTVSAAEECLHQLKISIAHFTKRRSASVIATIALFAGLTILIYQGAPRWIKSWERVAEGWVTTCGKSSLTFAS